MHVVELILAEQNLRDTKKAFTCPCWLPCCWTGQGGRKRHRQFMYKVILSTKHCLSTILGCVGEYWQAMVVAALLSPREGAQFECRVYKQKQKKKKIYRH